MAQLRRTAPIPSLSPLRLLLVSLFLLHSPSRRVDAASGNGALYTCVLYGNNVPDNVASEIDVDTKKLLQLFKKHEGSSYSAVAPGQNANWNGGSDNYSAVKSNNGNGNASSNNNNSNNGNGNNSNNDDDGARDLEEKEDEEVAVVDAHEHNDHRSRQLFDCPNSCSNSGSTFCRSIGCAYCGRCRRLQDQEQSKGNLRGLATFTSSSSVSNVEASMNKELAGYCANIPECNLWVKIFVVNGDGSLSPP